MRVSKRHMIWALTAAVLAFSAQIAQASGNNTGCCSTCCGHTPTHTVKIPNVTVMPPHLSISNPKIHMGGAMASATASASAYSSVDTSVSVAGGGGGGAYMADGAAIGMINGLTVQGAEICTAASTRTTAQVHPVQAVCLDDKGKAHPASRWTKDEIVEPKFAGEVYRCMAGTYLVATIGKVEAHKPVFDGGQTSGLRQR